MNRTQILLTALAGILVLVLFWLLLWSPKQDDLELVREDIEAAEAERTRLESERAQLRAVRDEAPEVEARLAAARAVLPSDPGLPAALRQLQTAADESNLTLQAVSPSRPAQVEEADPGISAISVNVQLVGSYFQVVDFLRRIETPTIAPRGLIWDDVTMSRAEFPELNVSLSGAMFAELEVAPPDEPDEQPETDDEETDDGDADVEVEVEVEGDE